MKKLFLILFAVLFLVFIAVPSHALFFRSFSYLTGEVEGSLDNIACTDQGLVDGDGYAIVITENDKVYFYWFDRSATYAEDSPTYIRCKNYTSSGVWINKTDIKQDLRPVCISWDEPTVSDDFLFWKNTLNRAITIKAIYGVLQSGTSVVGGLEECDANGANCSNVDTDITFNGSQDTDDGGLSNPYIDSGDWVKWHTTSVSAPGEFSVCFTYE